MPRKRSKSVSSIKLHINKSLENQPSRISSHSLRKVLIIHTGGSISMKQNKKGALEPTHDLLYQAIKSEPELHDAESDLPSKLAEFMVLPDVQQNFTIIYKLYEFRTFMDSSNMNVADWVKIAQEVERNYKKYHGFVILCGSDTLAYIASALSFMLQDLGKPVILTGSHVPIHYVSSDAKANIYDALYYAGCFQIPEVCILYAGKLNRGNRTIKYSATSIDCFLSPNFHILGEKKQVFKSVLLPKPKREFSCFKNLNPSVVVITVYPVLTSKQMKAQLSASVDGAVLHTYGMGNMQAEDRSMLDVLADACQRGILIVNVSSCPHGMVNDLFAPAKKLHSLGIVPGYDLTLEAALTKLSYVLGLPALTLDERKLLMITSLAGEMNSK